MCGVVDTLVVTVGLSPVPVTLSILTVRPRTVVFLHTRQSRLEAERIKHVIEEICGVDSPQLGFKRCDGDRATGPTLAETVWHMEGALKEVRVRGSYWLDYTGGTKTMVAAAVYRHIVDHGGDKPDLRSYVDDTAGCLVTDAGGRYELKSRWRPDGRQLGLAELALLNGYAIFGTKQTPNTRPPRAADIDRRWDAYIAAGRDDDGDAACWLDALPSALEPVRTTEHAPARDAPEGNIGAHLEAATFGAVASIEDLDEVAVNVHSWILPDGNRTGAGFRYDEPQIAEFDVIVRRGNQVLVLEAKAPGGGAGSLKAIGHKVVVAQAVFGSATHCRLVWHAAEGAPQQHILQRYVGHWSPRVPALARVKVHKPGVGFFRRLHDEVKEALAPKGSCTKLDIANHAALLRRAGCALDAPTPRPGTPPNTARPLVAVAGGSPFAVVSAAGALPGAHVLLIGDEQDQARAPRNAAAEALAQSLQRRAGGDDGDVSAGGLYGSAEFTAPAVLAITPATKAATAGFVARAATDERFDLLHVDTAGRAQSWRHGTWVSTHAVAWEYAGDPPYRATRPDDWDVPEEIQAAARTYTDVSVAGGRLLYPSTDPDAAIQPPLLIVDDRRAVAVLAGGNLGQAVRFRLHGQALTAQRMLGDAGCLLILHREQHSDPRIVKLRRLLPRNPEPIICGMGWTTWVEKVDEFLTGG